jgi:hypothetical protein
MHLEQGSVKLTLDLGTYINRGKLCREWRGALQMLAAPCHIRMSEQYIQIREEGTRSAGC